MHKKWMMAALEQAWFGRGLCAPNPSVGAVVVQDNQIVAKSFHQGAGSPHAEQRVLQQLPAEVFNLTLYVTLEPCNHWGKTPPCVDAIIQHGGITKVVYGFRDPNPLVAKNNTPIILGQQGIDVIHVPLPEVNAFYQSYEYWVQTKKPWVTAKIAQSLDGKIAAKTGQPVQISNAACGQFTHEQRLHADILLTTSKTVLADNPALNVRLNGQEIRKPVAILDRRLQLTGKAQILSKSSECHIFYDEGLTVQQPLNGVVYYPTPLDKNGLDLSFVIKTLGEKGYHDVWIEAGGVLFSALHLQNLVNRTYCYLAPKLLGENAVPAYHNDLLFEKKHVIAWQALEDNMVMKVDWIFE